MGTRYKCESPLRADENATKRPSGDHAGRRSAAGCRVRRLAVPRPRSNSQRSAFVASDVACSVTTRVPSGEKRGCRYKAGSPIAWSSRPDRSRSPAWSSAASRSCGRRALRWRRHRMRHRLRCADFTPLATGSSSPLVAPVSASKRCATSEPARANRTNPGAAHATREYWAITRVWPVPSRDPRNTPPRSARRLRTRKRNRRPSGRNSGQLCSNSPFVLSSVVTCARPVPSARTRCSPATPVGANTSVPSRLHAPPRGAGASASVRAWEPSRPTRCNFSSAK